MLNVCPKNITGMLRDFALTFDEVSPAVLREYRRGFLSQEKYNFVPDTFIQVAGVTMVEGRQEIIERLSGEQSWDVTLVPEPDNQYDSFAVKVLVNGEQVGYLPRSQCKTCGASATQAALKKGVCLKCGSNDLLPEFNRRVSEALIEGTEVLVAVDWMGKSVAVDASSYGITLALKVSDAR